jgi:ABC-type multidrug transport system fused ATPase/permease subunit
MTTIADYNLGDALLTALGIFVLVLWIWVVIAILIDLFRDPDLSGGKKAFWTLFILFLPFLAVFVYLIARGGGMRDRAIRHQLEAQGAANAYIREVASTTPVDDLAKLNDMKDSGTLSQEEYDRAKAKLLSP